MSATALADHEVSAPYQPVAGPVVPPGKVGAAQRYVSADAVSTLRSGAIIDVLVALDKVDQAWDLALEFGATDHTWSALVELRADAHPSDAIDWALIVAENEIARKQTKYYRRAVRTLKAAETRAIDHDQRNSSKGPDGSNDADELRELGPLTQRFDAGVKALIEANVRKVSMVAEFAKAGWPRG